MKFKILFQIGKFEGLYSVFDSVTKLGGVFDGDIITFPDTVKDDDVFNIVKPYMDYIQLKKVKSLE